MQMPDPAIPLDVVPNAARDAKVRHAHFELLRLRRPERLAGHGPRAGLTGRASEAVRCAPSHSSPTASSNSRDARRRRRRRPARCRFASRRSRSTISTSGAGAAWPSPSASCRWSSARRPPARSQRSGRARPAFKPGDPVVMYGALTCGHCKACREGRDNLCENVGGIMGFHIDGFARELVNHAGAPGHSGSRRASPSATPPARRSRSRPCSTCCSTMPGWSRARPCSSMPAAPASAPSRSRWPRRSAAP